jgi:hypothetical protein
MREVAGELDNGEIFELITGFVPAPLIDMLKNKGYEVWTDERPSSLNHSYFSRQIELLRSLIVPLYHIS